MPRVIHFEIHADDPERAAEFYRAVFGWQINKWDGPVPYWLATTGPDSEPGINGAIKHRAENQATVNTICVDDIEAFMTSVAEHGGTVITPVMPIPGIGKHGYCRDTEGNVFGVLQPEM